MGIFLLLVDGFALSTRSFGEGALDWKELLPVRQAALVDFKRHDGLAGAGVFVSAEGHVLANLQLFLGSDPPVIGLATDGAATTLDSLVALFPEQDLVLVKLKHRPRRWLEISEKAMEAGDAAAFLVQGKDASKHAGVVLVQRSIRRPTKIGFPFERVLSMGIRKPRQQPDGGSTLPKGSPLIDQGGSVCGVMNTFQMVEGQFLVEAHPLASVAKSINTAIQGDGNVPFPILEKINPLSTIVRDVDYLRAMSCLQQREIDKALKHVTTLLAKYPEDPVVRVLQLDILNEADHDGEQEEIIQLMESPDSKVKLDRYSLLDCRLRILRKKRRWNEAIATGHELVKWAPEDFPAAPANLARCYASRGMESGKQEDLLAAENWFKVAMKHGSDNISLLASFESLLSQLQRWKEADEVGERILKLEEIYQ